ncbi:hypothetical protein NRA67_20230, partial [Acinetobacter baumannii]|nr:hypothetical protein [Acinetobacter baumannii]
LRVLKPDASFTDAKLFLYMIEGAIIQRLSSDEVDERMVEVFFGGDGVKDRRVLNMQTCRLKPL